MPPAAEPCSCRSGGVDLGWSGAAGWGETANAVRHTSSGGPHGTFIVELGRTSAAVRITVYDCGWGGVPAFGESPDAAEESGRGLLLVAALADAVGCRGDQDTGHAVWAELSPG
jgi:anti-sigma regulatory factor (Ser/Thr protein kinase)